MTQRVDRRTFVGMAASTGLALGLQGRASGANARLVVGVIGTGGRGTQLATSFENLPEVEVAVVCDVDKRRAASAAAAVARVKGRKPREVTDLRRVLDDKSVDAVAIATADHWHAPAGILACAAGKHVYVEKPCSHNAREGELLVAAARRHKRCVQMGNQRRSWPKIVEAMEELRKGVVGRVYYSRGWYANKRESIGRGKAVEVPEWLDWELWQGPAPRRPYRDNIVHYNWHWFWIWGTGEIGNNGVHGIDLCRWGLGVDYPVRVTSGGGRYRHDDDQETPDTHVVTFEFEGRKTIAWEGLSCSQAGYERSGFGASFHGETGTVIVAGNGYTVLDINNKEIRKETGTGADAEHLANFAEGIRSGAKLASEIEEGHKSTLLCHLGNIAHRAGRSLRCDPATGRVLGDPEATALWGREYAAGWEPKVS